MSQSQRVIQDVYENFTKTAANIISYYDADTRDGTLKELQSLMKEYCQNNRRLQLADSVKKRLLTLHDIDKNSTTEIEGIIKEYKDAITEIQSDESEDQTYLDFVQELNFLLQHVHSGDKDNSGTSDMVEDFQLTADVNVIDPISKRRITDPVKNIVCGHTYDRDSITQLLRVNKKTKCPVIGCSSQDFVSLDNLRSNVAMKIYLEKTNLDKC